MSTAQMAGAVDERTLRVMALLREGKSDKKIAKRLGMAPGEVREVVDAVIRKARLDEDGRLEVLAERVGIVRHDDA